MTELHIKSAKKVVIEVKVATGHWRYYLGATPERPISIEEAAERASKLNPPHRSGELREINNMKKEVQEKLRDAEIVEKGPLGLTSTKSLLTIINVEPEGVVKIHPRTEIKIMIKGPKGKLPHWPV